MIGAGYVAAAAQLLSVLAVPMFLLPLWVLGAAITFRYPTLWDEALVNERRRIVPLEVRRGCARDSPTGVACRATTGAAAVDRALAGVHSARLTDAR